MTNSAAVVLPGATIGMVGGGQLGRMFAMAAASMGYEVVVFCESVDTPAAQVARRVVVGALDDPAAVDEFASQCDVITLEFENIPAETIARCSRVRADLSSRIRARHRAGSAARKEHACATLVCR